MTAAPALPKVDRERLGLPHPAPPDPVGRGRELLVRVRAWAWRHRISLAIGLPLLAGVALLRLWGLGHGPALSDDEGTYVAQAWAVQVRHAMAPYTYWYDHPPLGWIQLAGYTWVTGLFGGHTLAVVAARRLMVGYAVVDAALIYLLARRLDLRRGFAALAVALWALSPLALGYSRMVYLDNLALPWVLGAFVLAATPRRSLWGHVGAGLAFAVGVLSKETMLLLLPALLLLVWQRTDRQTRSFCLVGFGSGFVLTTLVYPLYAVLKGELLPGHGHVSMVEAWQFQLLTRPSTGSALVGGTQSHVLVASWLSLDSWLLLAGVVALPLCLLRRDLRAIGVALLVLLIAGVRPAYLPQPFVIALLPFAALATAAGVAWLWSLLGQRAPVPVRRGALGRPALLRGARVATATAGVVVAAMLGTTWVHSDGALASVDQSAPVLRAEHWLEAHERQAVTGSHPTSVLVDDTMWADLVTHGFPPSRVVWFYKLDFVNNLDPSVRRRISSYRDLGVIVSTPIIRAGLAQSSSGNYAIVRAAIAHSSVVTTFGTGNERIEIRTVHSTTKGSTTDVRRS